MAHEIIERLMASFGDLEGAIDNARRVLAEKGGNAGEIAERISRYTGILEKQKILAQELSDALDCGDYELVGQKIQLIYGLLDMIHSDARETIDTISGVEKDDAESPVIC